MEDRISALEIIIIIAIVCIIVGVLLGPYLQHKSIWNDGHCRNCGGNWVYKESIISQNDRNLWYQTVYVYECDGCGNKIETKVKK